MENYKNIDEKRWEMKTLMLINPPTKWEFLEQAMQDYMEADLSLMSYDEIMGALSNLQRERRLMLAKIALNESSNMIGTYKG